MDSITMEFCKMGWIKFFIISDIAKNSAQYWTTARVSSSLSCETEKMPPGSMGSQELLSSMARPINAELLL